MENPTETLGKRELKLRTYLLYRYSQVMSTREVYAQNAGHHYKFNLVGIIAVGMCAAPPPTAAKGINVHEDRYEYMIASGASFAWQTKRLAG